MKKVQLNVSICSFDGYFVGTVKVSTVETLVPVIIKKLLEAGIQVRGYESTYITEDYAVNPLCQASYLISEVLTENTELTDYVSKTPEVVQQVFTNPRSQN